MVHDANALADCLRARGLRTKVIEPLEGPVRVKVTNPAAAVLSEMIILHAGAFWWPWQDKIGPASDVPGVADIIVRVLAAANESP